MEKKKLRIRTELYTGNKTLIPDGFYCVNFYNQGTDTAVIMGTITVTPGTSHEFNFERDDCITNTHHKVNFTTRIIISIIK